ncbi:hypothetical protein L484_024875 [Morus notabilis]|uniref:Uncharacterized protein n=1 Tax=Morus notabilis TaxID=981085 RepID=W9QWK4_9ROSA|nr:hypothetical protein L484_024875 [Morus notabilis]
MEKTHPMGNLRLRPHPFLCGDGDGDGNNLRGMRNNPQPSPRPIAIPNRYILGDSRLLNSQAPVKRTNLC